MDILIDKKLEVDYIFRMNMAVSLDAEVFRKAQLEAEHLQVSVPELCTLAIHEFVQNHHKETITEQINAAYSVHKAKIDEDIMQAQYDMLDEEDW